MKYEGVIFVPCPSAIYLPVCLSVRLFGYHAARRSKSQKEVLGAPEDISKRKIQFEQEAKAADVDANHVDANHRILQVIAGAKSLPANLSQLQWAVYAIVLENFTSAARICGDENWIALTKTCSTRLVCSTQPGGTKDGDANRS
ncbi:hypothetical protein ACLOAV_005612 [Pseudogymnoascus australis]